MDIQLPKGAEKIIKVLEAAGFEAYIVGGCVRDLQLGRAPYDWDITTSARPEQIKAHFKHTVDTGIAHGTVTVLTDGEAYEVTTYRIDGTYQDGRHPDQVEFTSLLSEDLRRRDFTINAMAYNPRCGFVDLFGGMEDLSSGVIRCVGDPMERFSEDALRMMRALRFSAQLDFEIDAATMEAIRTLAPTLGKISLERIRDELNKLIVSNHPERLRLMYELGLTEQFLPEFDQLMATEQNTKHHIYNVGEHTIRSMEEVPADLTLRLTMLFHDIGKPDCKTTDADGTDHFKGHPAVSGELTGHIMRRLKYDNDTIAAVKRLVLAHDDRPAPTHRSVRRAIVRCGVDCFPALFTVKRADTLAQSMYRREEKLAEIDDFERLAGEIFAAQQCLQKKDLAINGRDVMDLGVPEGKLIGQIIQTIFERVVDEPELNDRDTLIAMAKEMI